MGIKKKAGELAYKALAPKDRFEYGLIAGIGIGAGGVMDDPILGMTCSLGMYGALRIYHGADYLVDHIGEYFRNRKEK